MTEGLKFSVIIPVYNRPQEVMELLDSLCNQIYKDFEVIIVEDGSYEKSDLIVDDYKSKLNILYYFKTNSGPGLSRNFGAEKANGNYLIFFDSDCIVPEHYFQTLSDSLNANFIECLGGPDKAHHSFSILQKAINFSMTSFLTTGGIRGGKKKLDKFYPRSFNMGFSKDVFDKTKGFSEMRFGEDIDFSNRVIESGFKTALISDAYVYHKRRTSFYKFYKQVFNSGIARINLYKRHPHSLKIVHLFPSLFVTSSLMLLILSVYKIFFIVPLVFYILLLFIVSLFELKSLKGSFFAIIASFIQLSGYGFGFLLAFWKRIILKGPEFNAFSKNFYK